MSATEVPEIVQVVFNMVVALMDRVQSLLDNNNTRSAVLMASADWRQAFDRGDPTKTTNKIIALGLRSSIVPLVTITKPPLFRRNRLTGSGNPTFESCVEVKAQQR